MRIGTHGRLFLPASALVVLDILDRIRAHGAVPVVERALAQRLQASGHPLKADIELMDGAQGSDLDMLISLGGDGSFLDAVSFVDRTGVPVLGVNLGRLGFLSNTRIGDVDATLSAIVQGHFTIEERGVLALEGDCTHFGDRPFALNEVSVHKRDSATMIAVHAYLDGKFLNTYWADGLLVATPTGSTAYSLSCGGPLLDPSCDAMVLTPIAPHNLNVRPFVVPGNSTIRLSADPRGDKYLVNLDSRSATLDGPVDLIIRRAAHRVKLVHLEGQEFLNTLREKLAWGLDVRSTPPPVKAKD